MGDGRCVVATLSDAAPAFDATGVPEPNLSIPPLERVPGGMGVHLIRAATDEFDYRPRPEAQQRRWLGYSGRSARGLHWR